MKLPPLPKPRVAFGTQLYRDAAWELYKERGGGWIPEADIQERARLIAARPKLPPLPRPKLAPLPPRPTFIPVPKP